MNTTVDAATEGILDYPTPRDPADPFMPSPELRALLNAGVEITRVRIWDGSTPWILLSHAAQRKIMVDPRASANDHLPNFPFMNRAIAGSLQSVAPINRRRTMPLRSMIKVSGHPVVL